MGTSRWISKSGSLGARPCRRVDAMVTAVGAHAARALDAMKLHSVGLDSQVEVVELSHSGFPADNLPAL